MTCTFLGVKVVKGVRVVKGVKVKCFSSWELKSNDLLRKSKYDKAAYDDRIETETIGFSLTYELNKHIKKQRIL